MPGAAAVGAAAAGEALSALKELVTPDMIRALSPSEGFEVKSHTFQAIETEGRWKKQSDFKDRALEPPITKGLKPGELQEHRATVLSINIGGLQPSIVTAIINTILGTIVPQSVLATMALPNAMSTLPKYVTDAFPQLPGVIKALGQPTIAEIEAVWWSDGLEIWWGQAAAKHVSGFNSLFGHQAHVELDGVSFGNVYPLPYCLTFTGYVNPVGPVFEQFRGAVKLDANGSATGLFCEHSNRDKKHQDMLKDFSPKEGYVLKY